MLAERYPRFCPTGASGGSCQKLNAEVCFQPGEAAADDGLRNVEMKRSRRDASCVGHLHERAQFFDIYDPDFMIFVARVIGVEASWMVVVTGYSRRRTIMFDEQAR